MLTKFKEKTPQQVFFKTEDWEDKNLISEMNA